MGPSKSRGILKATKLVRQITRQQCNLTRLQQQVLQTRSQSTVVVYTLQYRDSQTRQRGQAREASIPQGFELVAA